MPGDTPTGEFSSGGSGDDHSDINNGIHIEDDLMLLAAIGIAGAGEKHPLGVIEGASGNAAVAQALSTIW